MVEPGGETGGASSSGGASPAPSSSGSGSAAAVADRPASSAGTTSGTTTGANGSSGTEGPVPYERFKDVNSKYDRIRWAEEYQDPEQVRASVALSKWANEDPRGLHAWLESQLRANGMIEAPQPTARSREPQDDGRPRADYKDPTTGLEVYSAERANQLAQWWAEQAMARLEQRIAPIEQRIGSADVQQRAASEAARILADARQNWEGFTEFQSQIFAEMQKDKRLNVEGAYRRVVLPQLKDRHRQELLKELEQKSGASTESPASQRPTSVDTTKRSLKENFRAEFRRRGWSS